MEQWVGGGEGFQGNPVGIPVALGNSMAGFRPLRELPPALTTAFHPAPVARG